MISSPGSIKWWIPNLGCYGPNQFVIWYLMCLEVHQGLRSRFDSPWRLYSPYSALDSAYLLPACPPLPRRVLCFLHLDPLGLWPHSCTLTTLLSSSNPFLVLTGLDCLPYQYRRFSQVILKPLHSSLSKPCMCICLIDISIVYCVMCHMRVNSSNWDCMYRSQITKVNGIVWQVAASETTQLCEFIVSQ